MVYFSLDLCFVQSNLVCEYEQNVLGYKMWKLIFMPNIAVYGTSNM